MHLNHPETIPLPWYMENLSAAELVPGAKKVGVRWHRVKESPCPGSVGLRVSPVHGGQSLGASGNVNTPMLTCFQEPECFPSPEPLQSKVFSASWEKNQRELKSGYSKFSSEHILGQAQLLTDSESLVIC